MTDGQSHSSPFDPLKRYVPLAVWVIVIFVIVAMPFKIIGYGYLPGDDTLRHAAKAVSGKSWSQVLVLNEPSLTKSLTTSSAGTGCWKKSIYGRIGTLNRLSFFLSWRCSSSPAGRRCRSLKAAGGVAGHLDAGDAGGGGLRADDAGASVSGDFRGAADAAFSLAKIWFRRRRKPGCCCWPPCCLRSARFVHGVWYLWVLLLDSFCFGRERIPLGHQPRILTWVIGVFMRAVRSRAIRWNIRCRRSSSRCSRSARTPPRARWRRSCGRSTAIFWKSGDHFGRPARPATTGKN